MIILLFWPRLTSIQINFIKEIIQTFVSQFQLLFPLVRAKRKKSKH